jgi:hypothetical protein
MITTRRHSRTGVMDRQCYGVLYSLKINNDMVAAVTANKAPPDGIRVSRGGKASSKKKKASRATQRTESSREHLLAAADGGLLPIRTRLQIRRSGCCGWSRSIPALTTRQATM